MKSRFIFASRWLKLSHAGRWLNRYLRSNVSETPDANPNRRNHGLRSRLSRVVVAPLLVLALAVGVLTVDTAVDPEPAAAGWEWVTVYETVTHWTCIATPWIATAFGWAGVRGTVRAFTKAVTKSRTVRRAVNTAAPGAIPVIVFVEEVVNYIETEIWYRACRSITTTIAREVREWVEDIQDLPEDVLAAVETYTTKPWYCWFRPQGLGCHG